MICRLIAFILLFAVITSNLSSLLVYAEFKSNQKDIAAFQCENKDKPQLHCEGRCYLMKKLKAAQDKEDKQENAQKKGAQDLFFIAKVINSPLATKIAKKQKPADGNLQLPTFHSDILHPPPAADYLS